MRRLGVRACALVVALTAAASVAVAATPIPVEVLAPGSNHVAWASTARLAELLRVRGSELAPRLGEAAAPDRNLVVMTVRDFAGSVPAISVLELPFFYRDLPAVHRAVDGSLGEALRAGARQRGWELLAVWDEGLELMSGNYPYTRLQSLSGKEFVILRDDPIADRNFRALDVWTRRAAATSLAQLQTECLVSSRSATAQQIEREQLARVHLDLTTSRHRYEGWVVAMRSDAWSRLGATERSALTGALRDMASWQRERAAKEEARAVASLQRAGMTLYPLPDDAWQQFRERQPAWASFLPDSLSLEERRRLVEIAAASGGPAADRRDRSAATSANPR